MPKQPGRTYRLHTEPERKERRDRNHQRALRRGLVRSKRRHGRPRGR